MKKFWLRRELQQGRVNPREIDDLTAIADQLNQIELPKLSTAARHRIEEQTHKPGNAARIAAWSLAGACVTVTLVIISAQFAPENSPLYAIKRGTDDIRAFFLPKKQSTDTQKSPFNKLDDVELQSSKPLNATPKSTESPQPHRSSDSKNSTKKSDDSSTNTRDNNSSQSQRDHRSERDHRVNLWSELRNLHDNR